MPTLNLGHLWRKTKVASDRKIAVEIKGTLLKSELSQHAEFQKRYFKKKKYSRENYKDNLRKAVGRAYLLNNHINKISFASNILNIVNNISSGILYVASCLISAFIDTSLFSYKIKH